MSPPKPDTIAVPLQKANDRRDTLLAVCLSLAGIAMSITASGVALPDVDIGSKIGMTHLQWVMNGFIVSFAALLLPSGSLADRVGERTIFLLGAAVFAAATLLTACADSFAVLMVGRLIQGAGAALVSAAGPPALTAVFRDDAARKRAFGYLGAAGGIGLTLGGFLAGIASELGGWRAAFAIHLPVAVVAFAIGVRGLRGKSGLVRGRFDWMGMIACGVCITAAMTFGISGAAQGWTSPFVLAALLVAVLAGFAFAFIEANHPAPLVDLSTFRSRRFVLACLVCGLFTTVWVALFIYVPLNLRAGQMRSSFDVGATLLALMTPALVMPILAMRLAQRVSTHAVLAGGFVLMSVGLAVLSAAWTDGLHREWEIAGLTLCGAGAGSLYGLVDYLALAAAPPERSGLASGVFNLARLAGDALGAIIPGAVLLNAMRDGVADHGSLAVSRTTLNELAAGRFDTLTEIAPDAAHIGALTDFLRERFADGVNSALLALCAIALAGIATVVVFSSDRFLRRARCVNAAS